MQLPAICMTNANFAERKIACEDLQQAVAKKWLKTLREEIEVHFNSMPDRYFCESRQY